MSVSHKNALIKAVANHNKLLDRIVLYGDERGIRRKILRKICIDKDQYKESLKRALWLKHRVKDLLDLSNDAGISEEYRKVYHENMEYLSNVIYEFDKRLRKKFRPPKNESVELDEEELYEQP